MMATGYFYNDPLETNFSAGSRVARLYLKAGDYLTDTNVGATESHKRPRPPRTRALMALELAIQFFTRIDAVYPGEKTHSRLFLNGVELPPECIAEEFLTEALEAALVLNDSMYEDPPL